MEDSNFPDLLVDAHLLNTLYDKSNGDEDAFLKGVEDRMLQKLRLREEIPGEHHLFFDNLNSYYRMLVHRVARYYSLEHEMQDGSLLVVRPESWTGRPILKIQDFFEPTKHEQEPSSTSLTSLTLSPFKIMKRLTENVDKDSKHDCCVPGSGAGISGEENQNNSTSNPSLEERERKYEEVRARIFIDDGSAVAGTCGSGSGSDDGDYFDSFVKLKKAPAADVVVNNSAQLLGIEAVDESVETKKKSIINDDQDQEMILLRPAEMKWNNVGVIKEFIPVKTEFAELKKEFSSKKVDLPSHIKVITIPKDTSFKSIRSIVKKHNCRIFRSSILKDNALLLIKKANLSTSSTIEDLLALKLQDWIPNYYDEE